MDFPPVAAQGGVPRVALDLKIANFKNVDIEAG